LKECGVLKIVDYIIFINAPLVEMQPGEMQFGEMQLSHNLVNQLLVNLVKDKTNNKILNQKLQEYKESFK